MRHIMACRIGKNSITCSRGLSSLSRIVIKDKQGNEWFCALTKERFETLPDMEAVAIYKTGHKDTKKYVRKFLTFVREV